MKINIGGEQIKDGWKIFNIQKKPGVDFIGDISDLGQFKDNSVEEIYISHVFEHVPQKKVDKTLKGIFRILKPSGKFYVSVPDMDVLFEEFKNVKDKKKKIHILRMIFGGQIDEYDFHYFGYSYDILHDFLKSVGFKKIEKVERFNLFEDTSDYKPYGFLISLNVIAEK